MPVHQNGANLNVTFYILAPGGNSVVPAVGVVSALESASSLARFQTLGLTLLHIAPVNFVTSSPAVTSAPTQDTGLSTAELVAIVCGSVGGIILIIMIICVIYFV